MVIDIIIDAEEIESCIDNVEGLYNETEIIKQNFEDEIYDRRGATQALRGLIDLAVDAYKSTTPRSTMSAQERERPRRIIFTTE